MKFRIKNTPFKRDLTNMAVLCSDRSVKAKYEQQVAMVNENKSRDEEINRLKSDITEIKSMLQSLLNRGQNG